MKKILPILIILALLCSCAAGTAPEPETPTETPAPAVTVPDEPAGPETPPEPQRPEYVPGVVDKGRYTNDYFSLYWTLPDGWLFSPFAADDNPLGADFEMYAFGDEGLQSLSFTAGEGTAAEACASYLSELPAALMDTGYTDCVYSETTVTLGGSELPAVALSGNIEVGDGVVSPVYILAVFFTSEGRYGEFTATSFVTDATAEIIGGITYELA